MIKETGKAHRNVQSPSDGSHAPDPCLHTALLLPEHRELTTKTTLEAET